MNILILAWRDIKHPLSGGAEMVMHEHAQAWARAGYKVTLFTSSQPGSKKEETIEGVKIIRRGYELLGVHLLAPFWYLFGKHDKFDLVVDQFHGIPFFTPLYVRTKKLAVIQEVAREVWLLNHLAFPLNLIVGNIGYLLEPLFYIFYKRVPFMTGSVSAKDDLKKFGVPNENITIVHHGVSLPQVRQTFPKEEIKTVMFLGALTKDKGIEDAIEVFSRVYKKAQNSQFWIVGKGKEGSYFKSIKSKVKKHGLEDKVKFWGYVGESKKFELLSRAHVLIHPSVREGWGLTVVEASNVGTPTVGYNVPGLRDSISPGVNGFLIPYKDVKKMASRVLNLINNQRRTNKMVKLSREYAKKFTWVKSHRLSLSLIKNIISVLNILVLNWKDIKHPEAGGAEQATFEHAKAWQDAGHRVSWFASHFPGSARKEVIDRIEVVRRGSQVIGVQIAAFWWYFFGAHNNFDIVVDQFHGVPFFTPLYIKVRKLAYIHEVAKEVWGLNPWPRPFNLAPSLLGSVFEPWIFRVFYKKVPFMTVSPSTKSDLIKWGISGEHVTVVYNGVSLVPFANLPAKEGVKTAMFLGALSRDKGIEDAFDVFNLIDKTEGDWQFWLVGKGENKYLGKLRVKLKKLGMRGKVKFWGYVDDEQKFELLARTHVLINPSVREGWGLVNIEANSVGTPVVAYKAPGVRDSVLDGRTGLLSNSGDPRSLAANVLKLVEDGKLYEKLQKNAISWSKSFSWRKATNQSLDLIENL